MEVSWLHLIPLLPLCGAAICGLAGRKLPKQVLYSVALGSVLLSFLFGLTGFFQLPEHGDARLLHQSVFPWFSAGGLHVELGLTFDRLSGSLVLVITGVGFLIHLYSAGYMDEDASVWRYFSYLNLFVAAMLLLVLGDNLVAMFVGWEGVGLCSYLLIGFWFDDEAKASAGRKAFIVNRIGDFGFLIGIFTLFQATGTVDIATLNHAPLALPVAALAAGMLFLGACGKSAQLPLYIWLPDAMAGPTPVSALIHAATMVTAGVYMVARLSPVYVQAPGILAVVAVVGTLTALWAALIATSQDDIKKVLAYSTVSQLGYMFVGVGCGAFFAGTEHLITHAFFKACLFLGSGAVIHGLAGEQDMRKMGGLAKYMPHTARTFAVATVAITGIFPLSGFFSKDEILGQVFKTSAFGFLDTWDPAFSPLGIHAPKLVWLGPLLYVVGCFTALLTSFYMWRCYYLTFKGSYRGPPEVHPHESPWVMTLPLYVLAFLSIIGAVLAMPERFGEHLRNPLAGFTWEHFTEGAFAEPRGGRPSEGIPEGVAYLIALAIAWAGWFGARAYALGVEGPAFWKRLPAGLHTALENKLYVDEFYGFLFVRPLWAFAKGLWRIVDVTIIDGLLVNGSVQLVALIGGILRRFQNGDVQRYAAVTALGVAFLVYVFLR
jgi:NADH-quinone oxidoreductase subunit L